VTLSVATWGIKAIKASRTYGVWALAPVGVLPGVLRALVGVLAGVLAGVFVGVLGAWEGGAVCGGCRLLRGEIGKKRYGERILSR
jgi:hypothetical protein